MFEYAICEIAGKQVKVVPGVSFNVDLQEDTKEVKAKLLLTSNDGVIKVGKPYLEEITLTVLGNEQGKKIRVAKFHAKANYRRVVGHRAKYTRVVYEAKKGNKDS